ncbi:MAG: hypothetical protein NC299_13950 [Lachnospiraceae bacterium]|nr:hypothetical protein [Lachnospiraceae bacterium]
MSKRNQQIDYAAELEKEYARWNELFTNGGSDPFWTDGVGLKLVKNHILYYKGQLEKQENSLFGLPDIYYRELPPDVDPNYMARPDEIRENARKAMEIIDADENLKFVREQASSLSEAQYKQFCIAAITNYAENLRRAIAEDDLIIMRRYENPERYLESFESAAARIRDPECTRRINDNLTVCDPETDEEFEEENSETEQGEDADITGPEQSDDEEIEQDEGVQLTLF